MIVTEILARNGRTFAEATALVERDPAKGTRRTITWRDFDDMANRTAQGLIKAGIGKGDRVVHLMTNCLEWLPVYFGILRTGAWAVPINFRFGADTLSMCVTCAGAKVMIFGEEFIERMEKVKPILDRCVNRYWFCGPEGSRPDWADSFLDLIALEPPVDPEVPIELTDDAALYFTSGTTGLPKAALLTHRNLESACIIENMHHHQSRQDTFLLIPPLYHTGAKMHWFGSFIVGGKGVILKGIRPKWILEAVSEEQATVVWLLVPWALDILFAVESGEVKLRDYRLDQWRLMHIGAQPVPPSLIREWRRIFPHHQYDTNYGLTEATGPGCVHLGIENQHKVGAIGVPGFDWEVQILDEEGNPLPNETPGELAIRGPGMMKAYYGNAGATAEVIKNGWLHTGDVAKRDSDGFIWLVDRKKDVIITGGENIYPVEIEDFLQGHPDIQDVAVIGLPSLRLGEIATAIVQLKFGRELAAADIEVFCQPLPRYKRPRRIIFDAVPRNPTGKIEKPKLREKFGGRKESVAI
jgi:fatty-acyl-CoA synthase